jgi:hypothetical protein
MSAKSKRCECGKKIERSAVRCKECYRDHILSITPTPVVSPEVAVQEDREKAKLKLELKDIKARYQAALENADALDAQLGWVKAIREGVDTTYRIQPREGLGTSEVTPIVMASDWHNEEIVRPAQVSGLNTFNLEVFERRATQFWQDSLRLIQMFNKDVKITTVVLGLLGDFITGQIHEAENAENNALLPMDAIINAQNKIIAGIDFWLEHSVYEIIVVCKVGNHTRTTKKVRAASENGHSLESLMYTFLAAYYRNVPRIKFVIDDGYHTYIDVYDRVCRFHHGHAIKYQGGVGGLYIPGKKKCANWNKARFAHRDFFGHFHQDLNDTMFTCNGSLIGYNSYAVRIGAEYEPPKQSIVLVDKRRGFTGKWPVYLN